MKYIALCFSLFAAYSHYSCAEDSIRVAVAANFRAPLQALIKDYQTLQPQHIIYYSSGSSGTLYQQIRHSAPFNIFLSADCRYPEQLEEQKIIAATQRHTYALGELVLWAPKKQWQGLDALTPDTSRALTLATANPKTAPYGRAASEVIAALALSPVKIARGHSIAQTHQFIASGNVDAGFVARSQVLNQQGVIAIDGNLYNPIEQQMALLTPDNEIAQYFYQYLLSDRAQNIIQQLGYRRAEALHLAAD